MANKKNPKDIKVAQSAPAVKPEKQQAESKGYLWSMSYAPSINEDIHWFQMIPMIIFGAITIMLVHMYSYTRPMSQFYWSGGSDSQSDFFSHCKLVCIMICACLAIAFMGYRFVTQSFAIKKSFVYIPMAVYSAFVIISYALSDYKEFAWWGYVDRFEGTASLLAYMLMLFMVINYVNTEKNVKWLLYPIFISSTILGILGITQAADHDFFRTALGQKLITPNILTESGQMLNELIDDAASRGEQILSFTFQDRQIYQTVYNINYVSFYLTLLIPIVGLLFIRSIERIKEDAKWKPLVWGALFALLLFNLIGAASSGGFFGMAVVVLLAFIVLNKKILRWWKPVIVLLLITACIGAITVERWTAELGGLFRGLTTEVSAADEVIDEHHLDYFDTDGYNIHIGMDGQTFDIVVPENGGGVYCADAAGNEMTLIPTDQAGRYTFADPAFTNCTFTLAMDQNNSIYAIFSADNNEHDWNFKLTENGAYYLNGLGALVDLDPIPAIGFKNNPEFGSGRGYIWSRTFPMMKETTLIGHGADTYCIYFPHNDYVGKYNSGTFTRAIDIIVDKPHCMYMGAWVGTGGISVLALLALYFYYIVQSVGIYIRKDFRDMSFMDIAGIGVALGVTGFVFTGLVDDSTVSVMPLFYTMLGMGIAINIWQKKHSEVEA